MNFIKSIFRIICTVVFSLILICLVIFMVNNRDALTIHLAPLPFDIETRVFIVIIIAFLSGMIFGFIALSQNLISQMIKRARDKKKIGKLEKTHH